MIVAFLALPGKGRAVEVAPRITDREIIESLAAIRCDIKRLDQRFNAVDQRFGGITQQISELKSFMLWGFAILFAGMFAIVGFVLWDRRTAKNLVDTLNIPLA